MNPKHSIMTFITLTAWILILCPLLVIGQVDRPNDLRDSYSVLKDSQVMSEAQIDQLTLEILQVQRRMQNPGRKTSFGRKQQVSQSAKVTEANQNRKQAGKTDYPLSTQTIDLVALHYVQEGISLDQARLKTIEQSSNHQIDSFYRGLDKIERHELYDIADNIAELNFMEFEKARRSAIFLYLYGKR